MKIYCPKCGEDREIEIDCLSPGVTFECPDCKIKIQLEFKVVFDPEEDNQSGTNGHKSK